MQNISLSSKFVRELRKLIYKYVNKNEATSV